jgi:4-amino-4-deoxy-L-arabinose transferase-like glycosyltransferase
MQSPAGETLSPRGTALLLALAAALLLFRLGSVPLVGPDEPRYARVAVEMQRQGEWVTPTLQGEPWLEKPALYYWLAGAAYRVLGENETSARLPSVLAGVVLVGVVAMTGARLYGAPAGLHAGFLLATTPLFFLYGRAASMDMLLAAAVTASVAFLALGLLGVAGRAAIPAAYACAGVATLAKGPLGFLLPGLVLVGYALLRRDAGILRRAFSPLGILLFLAVAGPWYAAVYADQGRHFVDVFLLNHNLARFTSTVHNHPGPVFYYVPVLIGLVFPWSGALLPAFGAVAPRRKAADVFVLLWLALPFAFFSLAGSKLPGYILPCLAPLAILGGRALASIGRDEPDALPAWGSPRAAALLGLALGAALAAAPVWWRQREPMWTLLLPPALWALTTAFLASRAWDRRPGTAAGVLRVGGAGLLLLLTLAAPPLVARHESGRTLFLPAEGREVLAYGAWRTAWMAGYFYNDGRVREVPGFRDVLDATAGGPALVLTGPSERRQLENAPGLEALVLAEGPRQNALLRVSRRR